MPIELPAYVADWWRPIATAPDLITVLVSTRRQWTTAKRVLIPGKTFRLRWPFVKTEYKWAWVFSNSARPRPIDFEPTHWMPPPPGPLGSFGPGNPPPVTKG